MKARRTSDISSPHDEHDGADSVERFAAKHDISRAQAYKEIASRRLIARKVGARTIITHEDAAKWRKRLPKANCNGSRSVATPTASEPAAPVGCAPHRKARSVSRKSQEQPTAV
jgi:hypothetical protein